MGIFQGLERRLRGAVDGAFARLFGGSVQPAEVTAALQHEAAAGLNHRAGRAIAPNSYVVELGPSDSADVGDAHRRVSEALQSSLTDYVQGQGWETFAAVQVTLRESDRLHTGQFRVSSLIDPSVGDPAPATAYDAPRGNPPLRPEAADPFAILPGGNRSAPYEGAAGDSAAYDNQPYDNQPYDNPAYGSPPYTAAPLAAAPPGGNPHYDAASYGNPPYDPRYGDDPGDAAG
ncbi:MAG TPA: FhaA domain-containing protein, partial [Steroidobacteraceae bacterium]